MALIGYITLYNTSPKTQVGAQYFSIFLCATGIFTCSALNIGWLPNQIPNASKRAAGSALQVAIGQLGGVAAAYIYPRTDAPLYKKGHGTAIAFLVMAIAFTSIIWVVLDRQNKDVAGRRRGDREEGVDFKYTL